MSAPQHMPAEVAAAFAAFPEGGRAGALALRALIFDLAAGMPRVGRLSETLRWGQPSYLARQPGIGTALRLGCPKSGGFALYVHCRTSLIGDFRDLAGPGWMIEGNRAVHFDGLSRLGHPALHALIRRALTYRLRRAPGPDRATGPAAPPSPG